MMISPFREGLATARIGGGPGGKTINFTVPRQIRIAGERATALETMTQLQWGHPLQIWDTGKVIRVPQYIFPVLRKLGLLIKNKPILSPRILNDFADPNLHPITHELKMILGPDLSGPDHVKCGCRECRESTNLDDSRCSDVHTRQIVSDVKSKRRYAQ